MGEESFLLQKRDCCKGHQAYQQRGSDGAMDLWKRQRIDNKTSSGELYETDLRTLQRSIASRSVDRNVSQRLSSQASSTAAKGQCVKKIKNKTCLAHWHWSEEERRTRRTACCREVQRRKSHRNHIRRESFPTWKRRALSIVLEGCRCFSPTIGRQKPHMVQQQRLQNSKLHHILVLR